MPKIGMNLLLWATGLNDSLLSTLESLKAMDYDGVEVPMFDLSIDYAAWSKRLDDLGLERTAVAVRTDVDDPISPDAKIRQAAIDVTCQTLDACAALGVTHLVGPLHSALGKFSGAPATHDEWKRSVETMRTIAEHAGKVGVTIGIEPLNRFETYLINTHADGLRYVKDVGHPACGLMFDTFHANIEEKDFAESLRQCGDSLVHIHISENDRSTPGRGHIPWELFFDTVTSMPYDGWLTIEAFGQAMPELAAATKIWRRMFESEEGLARDGLAFIRQELAKRGK
jgi:D-psicose/D-tagatose/L-ribulose 3-epimerase